MIAPVLETEPLVLRRPQADDSDSWAALMADERSARFIGGVMTRPAAWRMIASTVGAWDLRGFSHFSAIEKASGRWVGWIGPWQPEGWPGREVGWSLWAEHWGQGYATEGVGAVLALALIAQAKQARRMTAATD